jgi:hypothetical protein
MRGRLFAAALAVCLLFVLAPQAVGARPQLPLTEPHDDALIAPPPALTLESTDGRGLSQYMAGRVAVQVILPESAGSTQNWSQDQINQIRSQIQSALDWWVARLPLANLSFSVRLRVVPTAYEPITYGLAGEGIWISDTLTSLGYTGSSYFDQAYAADQALRDELDADWATTIFVANSQGRAGGAFADGYFAYAYINGPFMVVTSDAGAYGPNRMGPVVAHELAHIFGALDQYASAQVTCTRTSGYLNTPTTNSQYNSCGTQLPSIMIELLSSFSNGSVDPSALAQLGYRDSDGDGLIDPLDITLDLSLNSISTPAPGARPQISGQARDIPFPSPFQQPVSLGWVSAVEYRVNGGAWLPTTALDGAFDGGDEPFAVTLPLYDGQYLVEVRTRTNSGAEVVKSLTVSVSQVGPQPAYHHSLPAFTSQVQVQVQLDAPSSTQAVELSSDPSFDDATWQPYSSLLPFSLADQDGLQTVYVRYRDAAGLESLPSPLAVTLDTTAPDGSASYDPQDADQLILHAHDAGSGLAEVGLQIGDSAPLWLPYQPDIDLGSFIGLAVAPEQLDQIEVHVLFRDVVGNTSSPYLVVSSYMVYLPTVIR